MENDTLKVIRKKKIENRYLIFFFSIVFMMNILNNMLSYIYNHHFQHAKTHLWNNVNDISDFEVESAIDSINLKKDHGPMGIESSFIKYNKKIIAPLLRKFFNICLHESTIPNNWKDSFITPVPKKGNKHEISNYRGICMQNIITKLYDKLITKRIFESVKSTLSKNQHGFFKGRSTLSNLTHITEDISLNFQNKYQTDVIYIDYRLLQSI